MSEKAYEQAAWFEGGNTVQLMAEVSHLRAALAVSKARGKKLVDALRKAETFIEDDTCRHDHEKAPVLAWIRRVLAEVEP